MLKTLVPLILGGSLGAVSRWGLHQWVDARFGTASPFPWGILLVNVGGCFVFGWLFAVFEGKPWCSETIRLAVFTQEAHLDMDGLARAGDLDVHCARLAGAKRPEGGFELG